MDLHKGQQPHSEKDDAAQPGQVKAGAAGCFSSGQAAGENADQIHSGGTEKHRPGGKAGKSAAQPCSQPVAGQGEASATDSAADRTLEQSVSAVAGSAQTRSRKRIRKKEKESSLPG